MFNKADRIKENLRSEMYPSIFCLGCGIGNVLNYTLRAIDECRLDFDKLVFLSGIGCSSRLPGYIDAEGLHTTHGRALTFATGVKLAKPELSVIIFTGDGDCAGIGGNHFIHAARRNIDMTVICVNNSIYGLTGGQDAPTTPVGALTRTTPYGKISYPFNLSLIAIANGATFCARYTVFEYVQLAKVIGRAMNHQGFSFIEVISNCHVNFGRRNNLGDSVAMREMYKKVRVRMKPEEIGLDYHKTDIKFEPGKGFTRIPTGIFLEEKDVPEEFSERIIDAYSK